MDNRIPGFPSSDQRGPERGSPIRPFLGFEGPRRYREQFLAASGAQTIDVEPGGLLEFDGFTQNWTIQDSNSRIATKIGAGEFWACPGSGKVTLTPGTGTLFLWEWSYEMGKIRAASSAAKQAAQMKIVNPSGGAVFPTTQVFDKIALGAEADYVIPAGVIQAAFLAPGAVDAAPVPNVHDAYIADAAGQIAAGKMFTIMPGASQTLFADGINAKTVRVKGTAPDILEVCLFS